MEYSKSEMEDWQPEDDSYEINRVSSDELEYIDGVDSFEITDDGDSWGLDNSWAGLDFRDSWSLGYLHPRKTDYDVEWWYE